MSSISTPAPDPRDQTIAELRERMLEMERRLGIVPPPPDPPEPPVPGRIGSGVQQCGDRSAPRVVRCLPGESIEQARAREQAEYDARQAATADEREAREQALIAKRNRREPLTRA